jgi:hypothetical protein
MNEVAIKGNCAIPANLISFFAHPPIRIGEDRHAYELVLTSTIETIEPKNALEWLWLKDLVDLTWEIRRSGKDKAAIVNVTWTEACRKILESFLDGDSQTRRSEAQARADKYFTEAGREWVLDFLAQHGLREDAIAAQAAALRLLELDMIDRQMERARLVRMAIARDILHHRANGLWRRPDDVLAIVDAKASLVPLDPATDHDRPAQ